MLFPPLLISAHLKAHVAGETMGKLPTVAQCCDYLLSELQCVLECKEAGGVTYTLGIIFPKSCNEI